MNLDFLKLKKNFSDNGFFICKDVFKKEFIFKLIDEINSSKDTVKYFDNSNNLRRVEKLYDKGDFLKTLNDKISILLETIFEKKFLIFKDKFNAKPPGGEGFYAHYDGIFNFIDPDNKKRKGWYEYGEFFINVLVALDPCNKKNGTLEISKYHKGNFEDLLKNTKNDGTPALSKDIESKLFFDSIMLNIGDIVVFSNTCPHRSKKNNSEVNRRVLYYTYSLSKNGSKYNKYFEDKEKSKNPSKALVDNI
jgi:ectoine hydroxylase-related dioxygenase (phytanoyl-CoA dioxygenase family)|tara:strand:+ start:826 stop:1572 length:747 start_codon:yes stop_codon:yes gene_type:complete